MYAQLHICTFGTESKGSFSQENRVYVNKTNQFVERLGNLAESEDSLSANNERLALVIDDVLNGTSQLFRAHVAHRLEHTDLVRFGLCLLQPADQLLQQTAVPSVPCVLACLGQRRATATA